MSKSTKIWLIIAASLVLIGGMIFVGVMSALKWNFIKLSTDKYETNSYEISEIYKNISITTDTADVEIIPWENSKTSVVCHEKNNIKHSVSVKDGTLEVNVFDARKWYEYIGINFGYTKIKVYLPAGELGTLSVKTSTGKVEVAKDFTFDSIDIVTSTGAVKNYASASGVNLKTGTGAITVRGISAGSLDLSVSTGKITASDIICDRDIILAVSTGKSFLDNVTCRNLKSSGGTGDISLKNVVASESFSIERGTGDVEFDGCDAAELYIKTGTGDVEGTLLSEKVFIVNTNTGDKEVPSTVGGGRCEITTSTGDIEIYIK